MASDITRSTDTWNVAYTVTIKGHGIEEPELGKEGPQITWTVDRLFIGSGKLTVLVEPAPGSLTDKDRVHMRQNPLFQGYVTIHNKIKDSIHAKYPEICGEYETVDETWNADFENDSKKQLGSGGSIQIDIVNRTLSVDLPARNDAIGRATRSAFSESQLAAMGGPASIVGMPMSLPYPLMYEKVRTSYPDKEQERTKEMRSGAINLNIPKVPGWFDQRIIVKNAAFPQPDADGSYIFDSGAIRINETVLDGVNTSGKVTIQVRYVLTRSANP
jgi:hypothetical protein